jgi:hypothetical protein
MERIRDECRNELFNPGFDRCRTEDYSSQHWPVRLNGGIVSIAPFASKVKAAGWDSQIRVTRRMAQPFLDDGRGQVTLPDLRWKNGAGKY